MKVLFVILLTGLIGLIGWIVCILVKDCSTLKLLKEVKNDLTLRPEEKEMILNILEHIGAIPKR